MTLRSETSEHCITVTLFRTILSVLREAWVSDLHILHYASLSTSPNFYLKTRTLRTPATSTRPPSKGTTGDTGLALLPSAISGFHVFWQKSVICPQSNLPGPCCPSHIFVLVGWLVWVFSTSNVTVRWQETRDIKKGKEHWDPKT